MQISSNLAGVIGRAQRLRDRDIPAAMARTLHPGNWAAAAKVVAEQTLLAIAQPAERQFIPDFIKTLSWATIEGGFCLRLNSPFGDEKLLEDCRFGARGVKPG